MRYLFAAILAASSCLVLAEDAPTSAPTVTAPTGSGNGTTPTFTWTVVANATKYYLWVDDLTSGASRVIGETELPFPSFTPTTALADNHSFRIWVQAGNDAGYGPWSAAADFATGNAPVAPPTGTPTVTAPTGTGNGTTPQFTWTAVANADFYYLWVDDLTTGTSQVVGQSHVTGTSYTPTTPLADNHSYRTWVQAGNVFGNGPWSAPVDFATGNAPVSPPTGAPTVTAPTGTGNGTTPQFTWTAVANADFYYLWVDDLTAGTSQVISQTHVSGTSYTPTTPLADNHSYRTWVQAGNAFGNGPWSAAVDFATGTAPVAPPTAAPTVTAPTGAGNTTTPTFTWTVVANADFYYLWVDDLTAGTSQVTSQTHVTGTSYTPTTPLADNHSYRTWVQAGNVFGNGPWSAAKDFATGTAPVAPPTGAPTVTAPNGTGNPTTPAITWTAVANADFYYLWVDDLTSGTSQVINQPHVNGTSFTPTTALSDSHSYRIWVQAGNLFGNGSWSTAHDFATGTAPIAPPAEAPQLTAPAAYVAILRPAIVWDSVADASYYDLWVDDLTTNTSQVIRQTQLASTSFTPTSDLTDGHAYRIWVRAGNVFGYGPWSAARDTHVDTSIPTLHDLGVSPKPRTNTKRPTFSGGFNTPASGLNFGLTTVTLDSQNVTTEVTFTGNGFSFTPSADLGEGDHLLSIALYSNSGGNASGAITVTTDYTPPAAPTADSITRSQTRITLEGSVEPDVTDILSKIQDAAAQTSVGGVWTAVIDKTGSDTATLTLRLVDSADNVSDFTVFQESFTNQPPSTPIAITSFAANQPNFSESQVFNFDHASVSVTAAVSGGQSPVTVSIGGKSASGSAGQYSATLTLPEGQTEVEALARDANGQLASKKIKVVVDTLPPVVDILSPSKKTTAPLGFLYVNGLTEAQSANVRNDSTLPRNVFSRDEFAVNGLTRDKASDLQTMTYEVREMDSLLVNPSGHINTFRPDLTFPFFQYEVETAPILDSILQLETINNESQLSYAPYAQTGTDHLFLYGVLKATKNLPESMFD